MAIDYTPKQIVEQLDNFIIGQNSAKKSVAVALRNRYRRMQLDDSLKDEIVPKNILMIGATGVGKTEIARRLAKLVKAPFVKVEATKFTEVGYVGRDVESMVRDLVEMAMRMVKEEKVKGVMQKAEIAANKKLVTLLVPQVKKQTSVKVEATKFTEVGYVGRDVESMVRDLVEMAMRMVKEEKVKGVMQKAEIAANKKLVTLLVPQVKKQTSVKNPFEMLFSNPESEEDDNKHEKNLEIRNKRKQVEQQLALGELEDRIVTVEIEEVPPSMFDMLQGSGMEQMGMNMQEALGKFMPKKSKQRKLPVSEARKILTQQEAQKLVDMDEVAQEAVERVEQSGIIFIDEIDKVAGKQEHSANVSREGVQRDILPIVEGSTVITKHGPVKTDHILFIAAGAFHMSKPSDLIPELQGRFPIRVELEKLSVEDFKRILKEPSNALLKQYEALLKTEGINVHFTDEAISRLAEIAYEVNQETDNIGARRLHTILEKLLEDLSFEAPDIAMEKIDITASYVDEKLATIVKNKDLSQFIL